MLKVKLVIPNIEVGVPVDDGGNVRLFKIPSNIDVEAKYQRMENYRWFRDETVELITDLVSSADAERLLAQAKGYTIRVKSVESYDVYSTYNVEPGDDPPKYTDYEIGYENLVIRDGELFGIYFDKGGLLTVLFPIESISNYFGVNRHVNTVRYGGQPLDYFVSTILTVDLVKKEDK